MAFFKIKSTRPTMRTGALCKVKIFNSGIVNNGGTLQPQS